jgi:HlyD family secretion protein
MLRRLLLCLACPLVLSACDRTPRDQIQGYVEGEFVYVASPLAGKLEKLSVSRGQSVLQGEALFALESAAEAAAADESQRRLTQAEAQLADLQKGRRSSEIQSLEAQLRQAEAALTFAKADAERLDRLTGSVSQQDIERARSLRDQAQQQVVRLQQDIETAKLGGRQDAIAAARAEVGAREAALVAAKWNLAQKQQAAPATAPVFDTFFEPGEWVPAGRPVVALLPAANRKIRAFLPERDLARAQVGDMLAIAFDGAPAPLQARITYISPRPEFTPPVIYSRDSRQKLVYMIEARVDEADALKLHPGQPVDVRLSKPAATIREK